MLLVTILFSFIIIVHSFRLKPCTFKEYVSCKEVVANGICFDDNCYAFRTVRYMTENCTLFSPCTFLDNYCEEKTDYGLCLDSKDDTGICINEDGDFFYTIECSSSYYLPSSYMDIVP